MDKRIERFEDLIAWQKARVWTSEVYRMAVEGNIARDFAECFERGNRNEFTNFSRLRNLRQPKWVVIYTLPWMAGYDVR